MRQRSTNMRAWLGVLGVVAELLAARPARAQPTPAFTVVPLGVRGGLDESNLSAYLVAPAGSTAYVCLDAGSLRPGLEAALASRALTGTPETALRRQVRAYLLSHAHLDHVAGLLLNAPADSAKPIYGLASTLRALQSDYLNWRAWPNFGSGGTAPLGQYQLRALAPGPPAVAVPGTALTVQAYPLSHGPGTESAAFLLGSGGQYLLYLGDTGADALEHSPRLQALWQAVAPLVRAGQLRGIFIEASYPNEQLDTQLYGHLTPRLLWQELATLAQLTGAAALRRVPIVIAHRKPPAAQEAAIARQLAAGNRLGLRLLYPVQGRALRL